MNIEKVQADEPTYRIGAVSRLTGVAQDTLRVWERRYGAVVPMRSEAGTRLYGQTDISRLTLIKRLVDAGDAISTVANLSLDQLQERISQSKSPVAMAVEDKPCRLVILGDVMGSKLANEIKTDDTLILSGLFQHKTRFLQEVSGLDIDLVMLEYSSLQPDDVKEIGTLLHRSGASRALVVYGFSSSSTLARLESDRIIPLRMPVDISEVRRLCHALNARPIEPVNSMLEGVELGGDVPLRRFSDAELAKVAAATVSVRCECPHHLVDLIIGLSAFENYSQECEVLNVDDAALHAMLHAAAAHARSVIEAALDRVIEVDGLDIE
jgi:DNA-binding transcriptional MerR regulator